MVKSIQEYFAAGVEKPHTQRGLDIIAEDAANKARQTELRVRGEEEGNKPEGRASFDITAAPVTMPTRPGQQPMVTMDMVKAAGFDNLRDYLNDKKGLVRRGEKPAEKPAGKPAEKSYENMVKFDPARPSMQPLSSSQRRSDFKQRQADLYYAKGGKINLDACGVSTHKPAKKNPNF
jgi:hypothetical protein